MAADLICYTAIFGNIGDKIRPPEHQSGKTRFVAFVDNPNLPIGHIFNGWELHPPCFEHANKRRQARYHKCLPHRIFPDCQVSLWVDGCMTPIQDVSVLPEHVLSKSNFATFKHIARNCIYQEAEACEQLKKDEPEILRAQVARFKAAGYPAKNGLGETGAVLRRHSPDVIAVNEAWWQEIEQGSQRDQMSLDYVCWKLHFKYTHLFGFMRANPHFRWNPHK